MDPILQETRAKMQKVFELIKNDIATVRTGRASPSLVENISVSVYGGTARMRVMELATVSAPDSQTLTITPYDASIIHEIQKGIMEANTGLNPVVDTPIIRISIPPLSQERRQELIHLMKQKLENGRILIRQARHDAMGEVKKDEELSEDDVRRLEKEIQTETDKFILEVDNLGKQKEEEVLQM